MFTILTARSSARYIIHVAVPSSGGGFPGPPKLVERTATAPRPPRGRGVGRLGGVAFADARRNPGIDLVGDPGIATAGAEFYRFGELSRFDKAVEVLSTKSNTALPQIVGVQKSVVEFLVSSLVALGTTF